MGCFKCVFFELTTKTSQIQLDITQSIICKPNQRNTPKTPIQRTQVHTTNALRDSNNEFGSTFNFNSNPFNLQSIRSRFRIERKWVLFVCCFCLYTIWWFEVMQFCAYLITKWKSHRSHRYKWVQHQIIQTTTDAHCVTALAIKSSSISSSSPHHSQRQQSFGLELCVVLRIHTCLLRLCRLGLFFLTIPLIVCATPQRELCESMFAICREARILCSEYCIYTSNSHTRALMACSLESLG